MKRSREIIKKFFASKSSEMPLEEVFPTTQTTEFVAPHYAFQELRKEGDSYFVYKRIPFKPAGKLRMSTVDKVFDFSYEMAFTDKHRNSRSGGDIERTNAEIFANTFQGKIAECAACNYFYKFDESTVPDFNTYEKGRWDAVDLAVNGKQIAIKSTKHFGQLLLLETKDWDSYGRYIPNIGKTVCEYDYILLARIRPSCEDLLKKHDLLKREKINEQELYHLCCTMEWEYDYAGYITREELIHIIGMKHILPKRSMLNGKIRMDAENYYVQASDLHPLETLSILIERSGTKE